MKERKVLISQELFLELYTYFEFEEYDKAPMLRQALNEKLDHMVMHDNYTLYKTAKTEEEREKARQEYLDAKGIHPDFRY